MNLETVIDDPAALARELARRLGPAVREAVTARGRFSVALPGGSVAERFFPVLAAADLDWKRVEFFWGDERAVAADHPDSNYAVTRRLLLEPVGARPAQVHRMAGESADLDAAARACEQELVRVLGASAALDLALLGVGPDGHVCSLFEGHPALAERARRVVAVTDAPKPPPRRLTLTLPALATARLVVIAAFGQAKASVVRAAIEDPASPLPVARVCRAAARVLLLLDPGAAHDLAPRRGGGTGPLDPPMR